MAITGGHTAGTGDHVGDHNLIDAALAQKVGRGSDGLIQKADLPALTVNAPLAYDDAAGTLTLPSTPAGQALLSAGAPTAVGQTLVCTSLSPLAFAWGSGSGTGTAFDPGSIANLAHYWVADNAAGPDGSAVSSVPNSVAGGPVLAQATTARQPIVKIGVANGHRVIRFTPGADASTDDGLDATITSLAQPVTWFVVHNINTRTADAEQQVFQSGHELSYLGSPSVPQVYAGTSLAAFTGATPQTLGVTVLQITGGNVTFRRNGGAGSTIAAGTAATGTALTVGRHTTNGRGLSGDIASLGLYSRALTLAEVNTLGAGLASTFGFTWTTAT